MSSCSRQSVSYQDFRETVFGGTVAEVGKDFADLSEWELQSRWFMGEFGRLWETTCGKEVEVVQFGYWNRSAGPDFKESVIKVGGEVMKGSIEIDRDVRDWERHGHAQSEEYHDVILHVFVKASSPQFFTRTTQNKQVFQVKLDCGVIKEGVPEYAEVRLGRCSFPLQQMDAAQIDSLLRTAAEYRLQRKATRLRRLIPLHGEEEALYQGIAEALGYHQNKLPFRVLAQRLPLHFLKKYQGREESLLFGCAGFLKGEEFDARDTETKQYLRTLWENWWKVRDQFAWGNRLTWSYVGTRPVNHPQRRLAALSVLVKKWKQFREVVQLYSEREVGHFLETLTHPYWDDHYTIRSRRSDLSMALIGRSRVLDILGNQVYPYWVCSRKEMAKGYFKLPALLGNQKMRRAVRQLLGEHPHKKECTKKYYQQQALLQIHEDFCLRDHSECAQCVFPEQLKQWGK